MGLAIAAGEDGGTIRIWIDRSTRVPRGQPQIWVSIEEVDGGQKGADDDAIGYLTRS